MSKSRNINEVLLNYNEGNFISWEEIPGGKINFSYLVLCDEKKFILQQLSPVFQTDLIEDIQIILDYLAKKDFPVPKLIKPKNGQIVKNNGYLWRLMEYFEHDDSVEITEDILVQCAEFLAKMHLALAGLEYCPKYKIPHFHETRYFLDQLFELSLDLNLIEITEQIGTQKIEFLLSMGFELMFFDNLPVQIIHGDPKIGNFLFKDKQVLTLIDYDTFMRGNVLIDLSDMLRSMCKDGSKRTDFNFDRFRNLANAYINVDHKEYLNLKNILRGTALIALELSTRYAVDCYSKPGKEYFYHKKELFETGLAQNLASFQAEYEYLENILKKGLMIKFG